MRRKVRSFDRVLSNWILSIPEWARPFMVLISLAGEPIVTLGISAIVVGIGMGQKQDSLIIVGSTAIITIATASLLKLILRRKRPSLDYANKLFFDTFSFPSGHATGTMVVFGLISLISVYSDDRSYIIILPVSIITILSVGISRIYLKAHYPSDVVGGWIIGFVGLVFILLELFY